MLKKCMFNDKITHILKLCEELKMKRNTTVIVNGKSQLI